MQTVRPPQLSINYTKVLVVLRVGSKGKINGFLNHLYNYMCNLPAFALSQVGIRQTTQLLHIWQFQCVMPTPTQGLIGGASMENKSTLPAIKSNYTQDLYMIGLRRIPVWSIITGVWKWRG